jgi:hypothetical protein
MLSKNIIINKKITRILNKPIDSFYAQHFLEIENSQLILFTDDGNLIKSTHQNSSLCEVFPESSLSAPPKPPPDSSFYKAHSIARILVSKINSERNHRVYVVLNNGYYVSSGPDFYFTELECDKFEHWFPENKYKSMMRDYWTCEPVNPFGAVAIDQSWNGARLIAK